MKEATEIFHIIMLMTWGHMPSEFRHQRPGVEFPVHFNLGVLSPMNDYLWHLYDLPERH